MIIDFHTHCFPDGLAARAVEALSKAGGIPPQLNGTVGDLIKSMGEAGIDRCVLLPVATKPSQTTGINDWAAGIQQERIVAFGSLHPGYGEWRGELARIRKMGLKGIKFHPEYQQFYVDDPDVMKIYEEALEMGLILVFHAGVDIGLSAPWHCTPERLRRVTEAFPGGRIVAAHMGGFGMWEEVERHLAGTGIYLDTSYSLGPGPDLMSEEQFKRIVIKHGAERILFGTDSPWTEQRSEVRKIRALRLEPAAETAILGGTAQKLLYL